MAIKNRCATCNHVLSVPDEFSDVTVKCPNCAGWMRIVNPNSTGESNPSARATAVGSGRVVNRGLRVSRAQKGSWMRASRGPDYNAPVLRTISVAFLCLAYALGMLVPAAGVLYLHLSSSDGGGTGPGTVLVFILTLIGAVVVYFTFKFLSTFARVLAEIGEDQQGAISIMRDVCNRSGGPESDQMGGKA